jgi:hypothetical protein
MRRTALARAVERVARRQHGIITREQALSLALTDRIVDRLVANGDWVRLAPGVFALNAFPLTWKRQYKAAELSISGSSIAGLAAARVLGFDGFPVVRPELVAGHTTNHRSALATVHRAADVRTTVIEGIRVTTPAQTLADIVTRVRLDRWERACDGELLTGRMPIDQLAERVAAYEGRRRRGIAALRALVDERLEAGWLPPESELEVLLRKAVLLVPDCPPVRWQPDLPWGEPGEGRLDGLIDMWGVVLEGDGRRWHARVRDFDNDRWRDNRAAAMGLRVLRFTWVHLTQRLDEVVGIITQTGRHSAAARRTA